MHDSYLGRDYGSFARQRDERLELQGMHEPCHDPNWPLPAGTVRSVVLDLCARYPIDGDRS